MRCPCESVSNGVQCVKPTKIQLLYLSMSRVQWVGRPCIVKRFLYSFGPHGSLTGHALEPVLEVEVFLMNVSITTGKFIAEFVVGLLGVRFTPG